MPATFPRVPMPSCPKWFSPQQRTEPSRSRTQPPEIPHERLRSAGGGMTTGATCSPGAADAVGDAEAECGAEGVVGRRGSAEERAEFEAAKGILELEGKALGHFEPEKVEEMLRAFKNLNATYKTYLMLGIQLSKRALMVQDRGFYSAKAL